MFIYPFATNTFQHFLKLAARMIVTDKPQDLVDIEKEFHSFKTQLDNASKHFNHHPSIPEDDRATPEQIALQQCERQLIQMLQMIHDYQLFNHLELNLPNTIIPVINIETYELKRQELIRLSESANNNHHDLIRTIQYFIAFVAECFAMPAIMGITLNVVNDRITSGANLINIIHGMAERNVPTVSIANVPADLLININHGMKIATEQRSNPIKIVEIIIHNITTRFIDDLIAAREEVKKFDRKSLSKKVNTKILNGLITQGFRDYLAKIDSTLIRLNLIYHPKYTELLASHYTFYKLIKAPAADENFDLKNRYSILLPHFQSDMRHDIEIGLEILVRYFSAAESLLQACLIMDKDSTNYETLSVAARLTLENIHFDTKVLYQMCERFYRCKSHSIQAKTFVMLAKWLYHTAASCQLAIHTEKDEHYILESLTSLTASDFNFALLQNACLAAGFSMTLHFSVALQIRLAFDNKTTDVFDAIVENILALANKLKATSEHEFLQRIYGAQLIIDYYLSALYHCQTPADFAKLQTHALKLEINYLFVHNISFIHKGCCAVMIDLLESIRNRPDLCGKKFENISVTAFPYEFLIHKFNTFKEEILEYSNEHMLVRESENNYRMNAIFEGLFYRFAADCSKHISEYDVSPDVRAEAAKIYQLIKSNQAYYERGGVTIAEQLTIENSLYQPADFTRPVDPLAVEKRRAESYLKGITAVNTKANTSTPSHKKKGQRKPAKYTPRLTHDFKKVQEHFAGDVQMLSNFYMRGLSSRDKEDQRAALLGSAKTLNLFSDMASAKQLIRKIEECADNILSTAANILTDERYREFNKSYQAEIKKWKLKFEPVAEDTATATVTTTVTTAAEPNPTTPKKKGSKKHGHYMRPSPRLFNHPTESTAPAYSGPDRNIVLIRGGKHMPVIPVETNAAATQQPPKVTILKRIDQYAGIRKNIQLPITPIPTQMALLTLLNQHNMDPMIHGGRVFYALLGINDELNGDLDVMCLVKSRQALRDILESNKKILHIADIHESTESKVELLIVTFNEEELKNEARKRADFKLEIACLPDPGKDKRCQTVIDQCRKYGLMCPLYDPFTATVLDSSNQVEAFIQDPDHILPFQPGAGDPTAYLKANPERILDIVKRKAVCLSRDVRLDIKPFKNAILNASAALKCEHKKFSMERFNRLFNLKYARYSYIILLEHQCIPPLFPNLRRKHYSDLERACIEHDKILAPLNLDAIPLFQLQDLKASFIANIFYNSFLSEFNITDENRFYTDSAEFITQCSFETKFDLELIQLVQNKWLQIIIPERVQRFYL